MNFSKRGVIQKQHEIKSTSKRLNSKCRIGLFRVLLASVVFLSIIGVLGLFGAIKGMLDSAPDIDQISIDPEGFTSHIYYSDGTLSQELIGREANRIYVGIEEIPKDLKNAFIALEDERFYEHDGIDIRGIFRAGYSVLKEQGLEYGASTITQQLLKIKVFDYGNEPNAIDKITRKIQEQYLAIKLEDEFTKDEILEAYLNNINLGNGAFGVQTAAKAYFGKDVSELTLSECTVIAPIAYSPVYMNPVKYPEGNAKRRESCLQLMLDQGLITKEQKQEALEDNVYERIQLHNEQTAKNDSYYSYFTDSLLDEVISDLVEKKGYTQEQATNLVYRGGIQIYSTQDKSVQEIVDKYFEDEANFPAVGDGSYYELNYALSIQKANGDTIHYQLNDLLNYYKDYKDTDHLYYHKSRSDSTGINSLGYSKEDMQTKADDFREAMVEKGDKVLDEKCQIVLQPQTSMTIMDQYTGQVVALYGGRGEKTGNRTLNRATDSYRNVGSTFKVLAAFLPALDTCGYTLASVMDDSEYTYPDSTQKVRNWDGVYKGLTTMREACYRSMNIVACRFLEAVTPRLAFDYLNKLGFNLVEYYTDANGNRYSDINYSLALGGLTKGVTNMQLTAGYAAIANNGVYNEPVLYTKVIDHNGKVLLSNEPSSEQVFKTSTAWLLTSAMLDTVNIGTAKSCKFRNYNMPVAGKTGTSTNDYDLWFVGYTPYYTSAIWTGFDYSFSQTNKSYHKELWRKIMEEIHSSKQLSTKQFTKPESITTATICTKSGLLAIPGVCDHAQDGNKTRVEYFAKGTAPTKTCDRHIKVTIDKESGHIATPFCPSENLMDIVYLIKDETSPTGDTKYLYPTDERAEPCPLHSEGTVAPPTEEPEVDLNPFDDDDNDDDEPILPGEELLPTPIPTATPTPTQAPVEDTEHNEN